MIHELMIATLQKRQVMDLTGRINDLIRSSEVESGLCAVTVMHTTAAISTAVLDPGTDQDMLDAYSLMLPEVDWRHPHDPSHTPDHVLATLVGPSVALPVENGALRLGTWQRVVLFEFDGPRRRSIILTLIGDQS